MLPDAQAREEDGKRPSQSVFDEMAKENIIAMRLGPGKHLHGRVLMGGIVKAEEVLSLLHTHLFLILIFILQFDYFHELIMAQEVARLNARGYYDGLGGGTYIGELGYRGLSYPPLTSISPGLPPIANFGKPPLRDKIVPEVLSGKKMTCLCISEAFAGSDVAGLKCHAKRVDDGWIVTGTQVILEPNF